MTGQNETRWEQEKPYSAMLMRYQQAAEAVRERRTLLLGELRSLLHMKEGTRQSPGRQADLEKRIMALRDEYDDLTDAIREIRIYAEREKH